MSYRYFNIDMDKEIIEYKIHIYTPPITIYEFQTFWFKLGRFISKISLSEGD